MKFLILSNEPNTYDYRCSLKSVVEEGSMVLEIPLENSVNARDMTALLANFFEAKQTKCSRGNCRGFNYSQKSFVKLPR